MTRFLQIAALAGVMTLAGAFQADAWTRNGTVYGPNGSASVSASGSCSGYSCQRNVTRTGPAGNTATRSGSASCANGTCSGTRTTTLPNGQVYVRQGSISR